MWLALAFVSAALLGFYDTSKKASLKNNAVLPVLLLNTIFSTLIFSPFLIDSIGGYGWFSGTATTDLRAHLLVVLKAVIVLSSWICGYFGLKHLPLTIVGPINATRPVLVLVGAMLFFGERLNIYLPDEPLKQEGGHRLQEQQVDMVCGCRHPARSRERSL